MLHIPRALRNVYSMHANNCDILLNKEMKICTCIYLLLFELLVNLSLDLEFNMKLILMMEMVRNILHVVDVQIK